MKKNTLLLGPKVNYKTFWKLPDFTINGERKMKVYAAYKNNEILNGKIFALPEQAFNFFVEEFLKEHPNAKINDIADELKKDLAEEGCFSIQAGKDEWGCKTYVREK